ncbi:hypothetical protein J7X13_000676 [Vibrio parahaemolyticus]|uniref:hypothetical protein n=1 Tax=Vibrio parahaemolyticus TaxID=670 RepID=UPI00084B25D6|nr:hypothetical protein [Vibrio parahaemolyticus]EHH2499521.1 hypothetical protein [Vibrio parahaemolyticus]ODZ18627.1 hypothetical protein BBM36_18810 [Vibrio parahaemolyticus]
MSKLPKPTQKQKQFSINQKGIKRTPEELKKMGVRKRIEEIEEQKEWDKECGDCEFTKPL